MNKFVLITLTFALATTPALAHEWHGGWGYGHGYHHGYGGGYGHGGGHWRGGRWVPWALGGALLGGYGAYEYEHERRRCPYGYVMAENGRCYPDD